MTREPSNARRHRERAGVRARIVAAALLVLETEGRAALTVRRIAADVEYTAPVVYQHFASKDALVSELVDHGYGLLLAELERAAEEPDAERRVLAAASRYVEFARGHPHLFQAMNGDGVRAEDRRRAAEPCIAIVDELLATWATEHAVPMADHHEACEIVWGTLYGVASLGPFMGDDPDRPQQLALQALGAILAGWRASKGRTPERGGEATSPG